MNINDINYWAPRIIDAHALRSVCTRELAHDRPIIIRAIDDTIDSPETPMTLLRLRTRIESLLACI